VLLFDIVVRMFLGVFSGGGGIFGLLMELLDTASNLPLKVIDPTYPYYTNYTLSVVVGIIVLNTFLQTIFIFSLLKLLRKLN